MNSWACTRRRFARKFQGEYTSTTFAAGLSEKLASKIEDELNAKHNAELVRANQRLSADKETLQAQLTNLQAQMDVLRKMQGLETSTASVSEPEPAEASGSLKTESEAEPAADVSGSLKTESESEPAAVSGSKVKAPKDETELGVELSSGSWGANCGAWCKEEGKAAGPVLAQTVDKLAAKTN